MKRHIHKALCFTLLLSVSLSSTVFAAELPASSPDNAEESMLSGVETGVPLEDADSEAESNSPENSVNASTQNAQSTVQNESNNPTEEGMSTGDASEGIQQEESPSANESNPSQEEADMPQNDTGLNADKETAVPDEETAVPDKETAVPDEETAVPDEETAVPDEEDTVSDEGAVLSDEEALRSGAETGEAVSEQTEPPYPFWKDYKNYPESGTKVYYIGKIYQNKWYANAGQKPDSGEPWVLVGDAEWTVPEDEKNYQKDENAESDSFNKILTDAEIETLYGGIKPEYSPEAALGRLDQLIPEASYNELFPYRFGSPGWKECSATAQYYPDTANLPDYYSYGNLKTALGTLANTIVKVQWYEGSEWCYRLIRLNKTTREQKLVYSDPDFDAEWIQSKPLRTAICDYGSFLAVGDLNTQKRELAGFLANISHETGGGTISGEVDDDSLTGLYFNEEVGFIGSDAIGYVQSTGTSYLPVAGKSYHGRGPIQLSYNYNYGLCSDVLFGDSSVLLNNPEKLIEDGVMGFMTGIWFWMTPQPPKPSCHEVITGIWEPKEGGANAQYNGNFGLTIVVINNESGQSENGTGAVARRARYYRLFSAKMGANIEGEQCDTVGMTTFVQQPAAFMPAPACLDY